RRLHPLHRRQFRRSRGNRAANRHPHSASRGDRPPRVPRVGTPGQGRLPVPGRRVRRAPRCRNPVGLARGVDMSEPVRQQAPAPVPQQRSDSPPPLVSYVLPVFNEEEGIRTFHEELLKAISQRPEFAYEFIYVNDGSSDRTLEILQDLAKNDPRVQVVDFSRNFGHQIAITAGLDHATGDAVIVMDTDLQDPPEVSLEMLDAWVAGAEIVSARRRTRQDSAFKRLTAHVYYRILRRCTEVDIPVDTWDFRLLNRRAAEELRGFRERSRFIRGMVASMGFRHVEVLFDR